MKRIIIEEGQEFVMGNNVHIWKWQNETKRQIILSLAPCEYEKPELKITAHKPKKRTFKKPITNA